ncbi:hypothetical protein BJV78DRAFT_1150606 [Lactifluus subvellereus]|nr:hypothetical protein BJV78DRAFT_1150606 [Lactifluus subvellereus]
MSIALLAHVPSWSNVWERLWIPDGNGWGLGFCGGDPDEEWDTYLTEYASSLPIARDRAGVFRPLSHSYWDRLFPWMPRSKPSVMSDYMIPVDDKHSASPRLSFDHTLQGIPSIKPPAMQKAFTSDGSSRPIRKQGQHALARLRGLSNVGGRGYRKREAVKFGAMNPDDSSSDDEDDPLSTLPPPARRTSTRSSVTLTNGSSAGSQYVSLAKGDPGTVAAAKRAALQGNDDGAPEYSDYEEDVTAAQTRARQRRDSPGWRPPFLAQHDSNAANSATPVGAVPMTPSLIRAVDRIAAAQAQAYSSPAPMNPSTAPNPDVHTESVLARKQRWEAFWQDVTAKVAQGTNTR